ncbi:lmo0937 family membrane protein [Bhargavaea beijingensis]|uniref:Lmo0937 family membrane protein n=1 Tax=Bhargavaea beijingensis TaxID=426756 RepID=A0A1G7FA15_9BACL|nr:lmo0937 family membrane protein [Bhargavaea beijingensis]MCW1927703.1 lmo0937 family membrane protein [Bhargavaea beijingensis]RSK33360.1 lmo0937 family membrane protein [Bhargavaea beijingensis]SDE72731.1 hypothetical protein SAMN04488126_11760 [Bhargavaea beijingensis]
MGKILWWVILILIAFWLIGFLLDIFGGLIHIVLIIAGIIFIFQLITGRNKY